MSIRLMTKAWRTPGLNPGQKLVLLAFCDNASDEGHCFPLIDTIAFKCSMSRRAVQAHIAFLADEGYLEIVARPSRSNVYEIREEVLERAPRGADSAGGADSARGGADSACEGADSAPPLYRVTVTQPSVEPKRAPRSAAATVTTLSVPDLVAEGVTEEVAVEFLALRRRKRAALTPIALRGIQAEAKLAGWSLQTALEKCVARGWQSFEAQWVERNTAQGKQQPHWRDEQRASIAALLNVPPPPERDDEPPSYLTLDLD